MRFSLKVLGDLILFAVFIQAFFVLCFQEQILQATRALGALEDDNERLHGLIVQQRCALDQQKNFSDVLECALFREVSEPIPYQES